MFYLSNHGQPSGRLSGLVVALACLWVSSARADLVLDISDVQVTAGESGTFDVTLHSDWADFDVTAWDTELVVDSNAGLIRIESVSAATGTPLGDAFDEFSAVVQPSKLQVQGFANAAPATIRPSDGVRALYRVHYSIDPNAPAGSVIAVNFGANQFTNVLDAAYSPVAFVRSGGTLTVSAVPEPAAWAGCGLVAGLVWVARRVQRAVGAGGPADASGI